MDVAALIAWIITALGGSYLLITWLIRGGVRQWRKGATSFPAPLIFGHFLLAASGLATWIAYVLTEKSALAWAALGILLLVAVLGFTMFARWGGEPDQPDAAADLGAPGATAGATARASARGATTATARATAERPAESHFPIVVVAAHGGFAVSTLVLVLLATLGIGS